MIIHNSYVRIYVRTCVHRLHPLSPCSQHTHDMDPVEESGGVNGCGKPGEFVVGGKSSLQKTDKKETIKVKVTVEVEISEKKQRNIQISSN